MDNTISIFYFNRFGIQHGDELESQVQNSENEKVNVRTGLVWSL